MTECKHTVLGAATVVASRPPHACVFCHVEAVTAEANSLRSALAEQVKATNYSTPSSLARSIRRSSSFTAASRSTRISSFVVFAVEDVVTKTAERIAAWLDADTLTPHGTSAAIRAGKWRGEP